MTLAFAVLGACLLLLLALPLAGLFATTAPSALLSAVLDARVRAAVLLSVSAGLAATLVALVLGVPLAYLLARREFRGKAWVEGLIDLPIAIPHTAAGVALLAVFGQSGLGGRVLSPLGLDFVGTPAGIVLAMLFVSVPFLMRSAREGFAAVDARLEAAARALGEGPWGAFRRVALPLAGRAILTGALLMWARGISEFGAVMILAYHPSTAPVLIWDQFEVAGLASAKATAALLLLLCAAIFGGLRWLGAAARGERA